MINPFMAAALQEGQKGISRNEGGPFGAVITRNGNIIARAHNQVLVTHDPTAHAEIQAIRMASASLGRFDLSDCELYTTCEPCPMCLGAIYWSRIPKIYYGCNRQDAHGIGFDDSNIYQAICGEDRSLGLQTDQMNRDECLSLFKLWSEKQDKTPY